MSQDTSPRFNPFDKGDMFGAPKENIFSQRKYLNINIITDIPDLNKKRHLAKQLDTEFCAGYAIINYLE